MAGELQRFLAMVTGEAAKELETAYRRIPEDKRRWSPMGDARTAGDLVAECAILNDITKMVRTRSFPADMDFAAFGQAKTALAADESGMFALLKENTTKAISTIRSVPDED